MTTPRNPIKPTPYAEFLRSLRPAGGVSVLAIRAHVGRCHLTQVLTGKRPGKNTWKHILPLLDERQVFHLKQCAAWNNDVERQWQEVQAERRLYALANVA